MKDCTRCKRTLSYDLYYISSNNKDGYQVWCKECQLQVNKLNVEHRQKYGPSIKRDAKTCRLCNTIKPVSQFTKKTSSADGLQSYCRPCWVSYVKKAKVKQAKKIKT